MPRVKRPAQPYGDLSGGKKRLAEDDPGWLKSKGMTQKEARQARLRRYGRNKPDGRGQYRPT